MEPTRRALGAAGCGTALAVGAVVLAAPVLLLGAAGIFAWLLGAQLAFVRALRRERAGLSVRIAADSASPVVGEPVAVHLVADARGRLPLRVSVAPPVAADVDDGSLDTDGTLVVDPAGGVDGEPAGADDLDPARRADLQSVGVADDAAGSVDGDAAGSETAPATAAGSSTAEPGAAIHESDGADPGARESAIATTTLEWPVVGTYRVGPARVTARDTQDLFVASFDADDSVDVSVRPRVPDTAHLGRGSDATTAYGAHSTGKHGPGVEPAELRPYQSGDDVSRIDWNATARLRAAYVAESEAETDRRTVVLFDHRATSGVGPARVTPCALLCHAALAVVESAREYGDPVGCYAVGDGGVTTALQPRATPGQYEAIVDHLRGLEPTRGPVRTRTVWSGGSTGAPPVPTGAYAPATQTPGGDPARATRAAGRLAGDSSRFAATLQPLLADAEPYVHRVADDPLFAAARTYLGRLQGSCWTVICSDGARPGELRETVKLARRGRDRVLVILAPRALYRRDRGEDPGTRRRRHRASREFQRGLAAMERVEVRELAPDDAVETVLATGGGRA